MRKFKFILPFLLLLFFVGCNNSEKTVDTKNRVTENISETKDSKDTSIPNKDTEAPSKISKDTKGENSSNKTEDTNESSKAKGRVFIDVKCVDKTTTFPFGMSKDNVMVKLKELKIEVIDKIEINSTPSDPEFGNEVLRTKDISFSFDKNSQLYSISVYKNIATSFGLKEGDLLDTVEKLYGKNYTKHKVENGFLYEYTFQDHYFKVFIEDDRVTQWCVSKYKFSK